MRPLILTFEGLNSFESSQTIDFERLTDARLFGIFGPTGAGKSSILDAMTLALFGRVDRAERGTRGIMNTRCDTLSVEFTFGLGVGQSDVYRVQRIYTRVRDKSGDSMKDSMRTKKVGLYKLNDGAETVVTAEKDGETTAAIEQLLGLSMEDFVHSVVLPQGKFSDFIRMKGGERRNMLERLFHLERFGTELRARLDEYARGVGEQLSDVRGRAAEIGDMSDDMLHNARVELQKRRDIKQELDAKAEAAIARESEVTRLYQLCEERKRWIIERLKYESERPRVSALRQERDMARRAEVVLPILKQLNDNERQRRELAERIKSLNTVLKNAQRAYDFAQKDTQRIVDEATRQHAELQQKAGALSQQAPRQDAMRQTIDQRTADRQKLDEARRELAITAERLKEAQQKREALSRQIEQAEASRVQSDAVDFDTLRRGAEQETALRQAHTALKEAQAKLNEMLQRREQLKAEEARFVAENDTAKASVNAASAALKAAEEEYDRIVLRHRASIVAKDLIEGQACPVCGSTHHPLPAVGIGDVADPRTQARSAFDTAQQAAFEADKRLSIARSELATQEKHILDQNAQTEKLNDEYTRVRTEWDALSQATGTNRMGDAYNAAIEARKHAQQTEEQLRQLRHKYDIQTDAERHSETSRIMQSAAIGKLEDAIAAADKATSAWVAELAALGLPPDADIRAELSGVQKALGETDERIKKANQALEDMRAQLDDARRKSESAQAQSDTLEGMREGLEAHLHEALIQQKFESVAQAQDASRPQARRDELDSLIKADDEWCVRIDENLKRAQQEAPETDVTVEEVRKAREDKAAALQEQEQVNSEIGALAGDVERMEAQLAHKKELDKQLNALQKRWDDADELKGLLRGNALVEYVAMQYLAEITQSASERLEQLSAGRYRLALNGDEFMVRDMQLGGTLRTTATLSGGETFLVSLSLALSLSLQLTLGGRQLGFFFLDEGFGTLDSGLLDDVMRALETLSRENFAIGVISHVDALKERIPVQLIVRNDPDAGSSAKVKYI